MKCVNCDSEMVKENFPATYNGSEAQKLHCVVCGLWGIPTANAKKVSKNMEQDD